MFVSFYSLLKQTKRYMFKLCSIALLKSRIYISKNQFESNIFFTLCHHRVVPSKFIRHSIASYFEVFSGLQNFILRIPSQVIEKFSTNPTPQSTPALWVKLIAENMKWNSPWRNPNSLIRSLNFLFPLPTWQDNISIIDFVCTKAAITLFQIWRQFKEKIL